MTKEDTRRSLVDATIRVIAKDGIENATTKLISSATGINEAYIYRHFTNKIDMFVKAFDYLDDELFSNVLQCADNVIKGENIYEKWCSCFFSPVLEHLMSDREKWLMYLQYYYSPYFALHSSENHKKRLSVLVSRLKGTFRDDTKVEILLDYILITMLDYVFKVDTQQISYSDRNNEETFFMIFNSIKRYLKTEDVKK